ncbi:GTP-binding protein, partial [Corallococcus exiguus]|nr:GTP-binding protein [Corallococcus exiguus]
TAATIAATPVPRTLTTPAPPRVEPAAMPAVAVTPNTGSKLLGPTSALAPGDLFDHARAAEAAFTAGDYTTCVTACTDAVRRAMAFAGEGSLAQQAFLLHVDGSDLLRLQGLSTLPQLRVDDAAFALYVLMQVFVRLNAVGLPTAG